MIKIKATGQGFASPIEIRIISATRGFSSEESYDGECCEEGWSGEIIDKLREQKLGSGVYAYRYQDIEIEKVPNESR